MTPSTPFSRRRRFSACGDSPERFTDLLAAKLRRWILLVPAGVGFATLRACLKLLVGVPPIRSGVFSAGNGPAMRSALLGACYGDQPEKLKAFVRASARLTHTDPKAKYGAVAVALAAHFSANGSTDTAAYFSDLHSLLPDDADAGELIRLLTLAAASAERGESTEDFATGVFPRADRVTGYVYQTVPAALHAWIRHPNDYPSAVLEVIACGGDTDTVAAITGAIIGAGVSEKGIPAEWISGIADWPYSVKWMRLLGDALAQSKNSLPTATVPDAPLPARMLHNAVFILVVLVTLLGWYSLDVVCFVRSLLNGTFRANYLN